MYGEIHPLGRPGQRVAFSRSLARFPALCPSTFSSALHIATIAAVRESHNSLDTTSDSLGHRRRQPSGSIYGMQFTEDNAPR